MILVVCTGNICRSPMAQALLARHLAERGIELAVASAGTLGWNSGPALDEALLALSERGVQLDGHISRRINGDVVRAADLVLTMTNDHAEAVRLHAPDVAGRVFVLGEFLRLAQAVGERGAESMAEWVARVDATRPAQRRRATTKDEVPDPLGEPMEVYRQLAEHLDRVTERIAELL